MKPFHTRWPDMAVAAFVILATAFLYGLATSGKIDKAGACDAKALQQAAEKHNR